MMSYEINQYKQHAVATERSIIETLIVNIRVYSDTSNKKEVRIKAIYDNCSILEHLCIVLDMESVTGRILRTGFHQILDKCMKAHIDDRNKQNFEEELGFLAVIRESL